MGNSDTGVEGGDVPDPCLGHVTIPFLHFDNDPAKREKNFLGFGDDGDDKVGESVIDLEFDDFGVDEDEAEVVGAEAVEEAEEEGIDAD